MNTNTNLAYSEDWQEEVINGEIMLMSPCPGWNHVSVAGTVYNIFFNYLKGKKCTAIPDGFDLYLTEKDIFVPDMMVVCDREKIKKNGVYGAPDLVVEVLSPSTAKNDRTRKKDAYAKSGVREYWIISPSEKLIEVYHNSGGDLILHDIYALEPDWRLARMTEEARKLVKTRFRCSLFEDLEISLEEIFYGTI